MMIQRTHGPRFSWFEWAGLNLLAIENEVVKVVIWPAHGAQIIEFRHKASDFDVLWKNARVWPPRSDALDQPHASRSEFYDTFNGGWFSSLPNGFFPSHWPDAAGPLLGCHGEWNSLPWDVEVVRCDRDEVVVRAAGRGVRTPLLLERRWSLKSGSAVLEWDETLHNESDIRLPVAWLHHPGFGGPLIEGARLFCDAGIVATPPSNRPELGQLQSDFRGPWPNVPEQDGVAMRDCSRVPEAGQATMHVVELSDFQRGWGGVWNENRRLGFALEWDKTVFSCAWSWMAGRSEGYPLWGNCHTVTLQPSTSPMRPFAELLERDEVRWIEPRGSISTRLSSGFCASPNEEWKH